MKKPIRFGKIQCSRHGLVKAYLSRQVGRKKPNRECVVCKRMYAWTNYHQYPVLRQRELNRSKEWKRKNPEKVKAYRSTDEYKFGHRAYGKLYREANRERINAYKRARYHALKQLQVVPVGAHEAQDDTRNALPSNG